MITMPCDHKRKDGINYCGNCNADLELGQDEIDARDRLYTIFEGLFKEKVPDVKFNRAYFDSFMSRNGARMATMVVEMFAKDEGLNIKGTSKKSKITIENLAYRKLLELKNPLKENEIIRFPRVFGKICTHFSIPKDVAFIILQQLEDQGLIEIVPYNGVRVL